ncbi:winged helix-turn-helix domain-containing protein [Streptomyces sp. NPDC051576]|uniref:winged helix-turn-helix domain-containing protein n=1 Tax=Streptomyces sp. NPDC051576 TaxID=3155803 RepID=UPI00342FCDAB
MDHHGIAEALRERIRQGELAAGDRMPTQARLADEFGAERSTVRRALDLLNQEGLLTGVTRGAPPRVAERSGLGRPSQTSTTTGRLSDALAAAFTAPHVTVEVFTLSGESLDSHLRLCAEMLMAETLPPPRSVAVRILLPVIADSLPLFRTVDAPQETRPRQRLADLTRRHTTSIRNTVYGLRDSRLTESVSFEVRQAPITPLQKFYVLNGSEALSGYYQAVRRPILLDDGAALDVYDLLGSGTRLFHRSTGSPFVEKARDWFEYHWSSTDTVPFETPA